MRQYSGHQYDPRLFWVCLKKWGAGSVPRARSAILHYCESFVCVPLVY
jgi:hypothetical protein